MTQKELKRLKRAELLELLVEQVAEVESLREQLRQAEAALEKRELLQRQAGTLAEAALYINQVFAAADRTAEDYLNNVRRLAEEGAQEEPVQEELELPLPEESGALVP